MSNPNSIIADACGANATRGYSTSWWAGKNNVTL